MATEVKLPYASDVPNASALSAIERYRQAVRVVLELAKARVSLMVVATAGLGFFLAAWPNLDGWLMFQALAATGLLAGGAAALNQWIERDYDRQMTRTAGRPLPSGRMPAAAALFLGCVWGLIGFVWLLWSVNGLTALLGALTFLLYVGVYTPLKRITVWNTVIGAIPGAIPPMMGWTAVSGELGIGAWLLFGILFCWQMPHFYAIAWLNRDDYQRAGYRMLSHHDHDGKSIGRHSVGFAACLLIVSIFAALLSASASSVAVTVSSAALTLLLSGYFLFTAISFSMNRMRLEARRLFFASILFIPLMSALLVTVKIIGQTSFALAGAR